MDQKSASSVDYDLNTILGVHFQVHYFFEAKSKLRMLIYHKRRGFGSLISSLGGGHSFPHILPNKRVGIVHGYWEGMLLLTQRLGLALRLKEEWECVLTLLCLIHLPCA